MDQGAFRHDWVLHLDADEIVTAPFVRALEDLAPIDGVDAWRVPSKTMLFGRWLRYAGLWPSYQVRLGHARRLRFVQVGHGQRECMPGGRVAVFPEAYLHFAFSHGAQRWLQKHVDYARAEAEALRERRPGPGRLWRALFSPNRTEARRAAKSLTAALPLAFRPLAKFVYVLSSGWDFATVARDLPMP